MAQAEVVAFVGGLVVGSFLNVCIHRLPAGESLIRPGSRCPHCQAPIRPRDNVPLLSFLLLRARCRACAGAIAWRYPAVELLTGLLFLGVVWRFGIGGRAALWGAFLAALVVVTFIDLEHLIVPDRISLPGIAVGLVGAGLWPPPGLWSAALGVLIGGGFFWVAAWASALLLKAGRIEVDAELRVVDMDRTAGELLGLTPEGVRGRPCVEAFGADSVLLRAYREAAQEGRRHARVELDLPQGNGSFVPLNLRSTIRRGSDGAVAGATLRLEREGMGGGDIKLAGMIGAFLGWQGVLVTILLGTLAGSVIGIALVATGLTARKQPIPFGPFLALGAAAALFWGEAFLHWYGRLLR